MKNAGKELLIFLAVTYGLTFLMGIPMAILSHLGKDVSSFAGAQMFYPAAGLMLARLTCRKGDPLMPRNFYLGFLVLAGAMVLRCLLGFILPEELLSAVGGYLPILGGVVVWLLYLSEPKERRVAYGLAGKNWPQSIPLLGLFLVFYLTGQLLPSLILEGPAAWTASLSLDANMGWLIYSVPFSILASFLSLFGEEYGWRTYFQPLLQEKAGRIKGVFLFGVLWELWHLPLVLCYYAPQAAGSTLAQVLCMRYGHVILLAVFLAYAYGKTGNLWLPVLIHGMNNTVAGVLESLFPGDAGPASWGILGLSLLISALCFLPFLFSNVFRQPTNIQAAPSQGEGG